MEEKSIDLDFNFNGINEQDIVDGFPEVFNIYDINDVQQIKENELFGIIPSEIKLMAPFVSVENNSYCFLVGLDLEDSSYYSDEIDIINGKDIPLIMRKLSGNLAQEVLSGEVFVLTGNFGKFESPIMSSDSKKDFELFQKNISKFADNNVVLSCTARELAVGGSKKIDNAFFVIDDAFKYLYNEETLSRKDDIIAALKSLKSMAKAEFDEDFKKVVNTFHSIANTDNFLFDIEHSEIENNQKSR